MREEVEQFLTALMDHAAALQSAAEAQQKTAATQQETVQRLFQELPQGLQAAAQGTLAQVVQAESKRLAAEANRIERLARSATLRWGGIYALGALVLGGVIALAGWWPVHQASQALSEEAEALKLLKADEAAIWAGIQQGQKGDLIGRCNDARVKGRLCVRINRAAGEYGDDRSYAVVWGH